MLSSSFNKGNIYKRFPRIELSYEDSVYKKVHNADLYLAIPSSKKCFAWFTYFNDKSVCFIIDIENDKFSNIQSHPCCFDKSLSLGSILYGSIITTPAKHNVFCAEDILQYKGKMCDKLCWNNRISNLNKFMKHISPHIFTDKFLLISVVIFSKNYKQLEVFIENSIYDIDYIQARKLDSQKFENFNINQIKKHQRNTLPTANFMVKSTIQTEIYELYCGSSYSELYNIAHIPDYKTSVLMNTIFRNIRENHRLDLMEESEDEDEFENISDDKYVDIKKKVIMRCIYSYRFKRWIPQEIINDTSKLITHSELKILERKN